MSQETEDVIVDYDEIEQDRPLSLIIRIDQDTYVIPKSQIRGETDSSLTIPEWLAKERGLI